jgi:hypothetical protein
MRRPSLTVVAAFYLCLAIDPLTANAQIPLPDKTQWKLHDGSMLKGKAYTFGSELCFIQRRGGKILMNGQKLDDPSSNVLLTKICEEKQLPLNDPKQLQAILSRQPFAQVVDWYATLKYHDDAGRDRQVPVLLLAPEEKNLLRPMFEEWRAEKQREHEEQVRRAQELQNQQAMLFMQAQALQAQQAMAIAAESQAYSAARNAAANERAANAAERNATANKKQAEELERIRRGRR